MAASLFSIVASLLILISATFLIYRLGLFTGEKVSGRYAFLFGGIFLFVTAVWQVIRFTTEYNDWFVEGAYPVLDAAQIFLFVAGVALSVVGLALYADFWQTRKDELSNRDQQLSILSNLQADSREPYQTIELLELSIKEIVSHLPETAGAIFFLNRTQRQLVLTSAVGFTKQETAFLERYPYGQNVISQAVESMQPVISGSFDFIDASGKSIISKFNSCLVLPLVSGSEKIGAMVLAAQASRFFSRSEIRYLSPVADWLAEMIKSSRLTKDLAAAKRDLEQYETQYSEFTRRIIAASDAFTKTDILESFCSSLVGLVSSQSVHVLGMKNGALNFYGSSEPLVEMSESFKTALIDALDRKKPLIINQEGTTDEGRTYIARSTLLYPFGKESDEAALLFIKDGSPFRVAEEELKEIDVYGRLALLTIKQKDTQRLDITRRKGLDKILQLLRLDASQTFESNPGLFVSNLSSVLPPRTAAVTLARQADSSFAAVDGLRAGDDTLNSLRTLPGEGAVGEVAAGLAPSFVSGKHKITQELQAYDEVNRDAIQRMFGEKGTPNFMAVCPIIRIDDVVGVVKLFLFDISENEKSEWQRLLTLATGLLSLRLTINAMHAEPRPVRTEVEGADPQVIGEAINRLNNHLSAIVGNAGLAETREDLTGELRNHFRSIINEAERAAEYLKTQLGSYSAELSGAAAPSAPEETVNDAIESVLASNRISDNLYMVGGRAREISRTLDRVDRIEFKSSSVRELFEEALGRFASLADDEDVITVATYLKDNYVYLDISRHHRDFPPVRNVARFGHYQRSGEVLQYRPADTFLKHVEGNDCFYSFDRVATVPSYLSFKFPVSGSADQPSGDSSRPRILAIDDQAVILDLIQAMCQTTGYEVQTADTGEEGLKLALSQKYDIILTDLAMPGLSGLEIAHEVRKKKPDVPIVLVTGWEVNISPEKMAAAGITRVLYKPFRIEQLTDIIGTLLESRSIS